MYCTQCGNKLGDGDRFCRQCGAKIRVLSEQDNQLSVRKQAIEDEASETMAFIDEMFANLNSKSESEPEPESESEHIQVTEPEITYDPAPEPEEAGELTFDIEEPAPEVQEEPKEIEVQEEPEEIEVQEEPELEPSRAKHREVLSEIFAEESQFYDEPEDAKRPGKDSEVSYSKLEKILRQPKYLVPIVAVAVVLLVLIASIPKLTRGTSDEELLEQIANSQGSNAASTEDTTGADSTGSAETEADSDDGDGSDGTATGTDSASTTSGESLVQNAISTYVAHGPNIGYIEAFYDLKFTEDREYHIEDLAKALVFDDDLWYINDQSENVHYTPEIVRTLIEYFSALQDRRNSDDEAVLKMITKDSKLYGDVKAIKADAVVIHTLDKMQIGEMRRSGDDFYILVQLYESTNDGKADTETIKTVHLIAKDKVFEVNEVVDAEGK